MQQAVRLRWVHGIVSLQRFYTLLHCYCFSARALDHAISVIGSKISNGYQQQHRLSVLSIIICPTIIVKMISKQFMTTEVKIWNMEQDQNDNETEGLRRREPGTVRSCRLQGD